MSEYLGDVKQIVQPKRKTISLQVINKTLLVKSPKRLRAARLQALLDENQGFIQQQLRLSYAKYKFTNGEVFCLLGKQYNLKLINENHCSVTLKKNHIVVTNASLSATEVRDVLLKYMMELAYDHITESVHLLSKKTRLNPSEITIKNFKSRYGSCDCQARIKLNWRLIMAPQSVIDYVIVHELCHIKHLNHSAAFWVLVEKHCPDYKLAINWLKQKTSLLLHTL